MAKAPYKKWRAVKRTPGRLQDRPRDQRGLIIPYSVDDGTLQPDFRVTQTERVRELVRTEACFMCGKSRDHWMCFLGGPISVRAKTFTDGWMHEACAAYAIRVCPYLALPHAEYSQYEQRDDTPPAVRPEEFGLVYTRGFRTLVDPHGGLYFKAGVYQKIHWYGEYGKLMRIGSGSMVLLYKSDVKKKLQGEGRIALSTERVRRYRARKKAREALAKQLAWDAAHERQTLDAE